MEKNVNSIAFVMYWFLFISRIYEFDRLFETLLVGYIERPVNDFFPDEVLSELCQLSCFKSIIKDELITSIIEEEDRIHGLYDIVYNPKIKEYIKNIITNIIKNKDIIKILSDTINKINPYFNKKIKLGIDKYQIDEHNKRIKQTNWFCINQTDEDNIIFDNLYNEMQFCASMAIICYYRRQDKYQFAIDLLSNIKIINKNYEERIFYQHNDIRFKIENMNNIEQYYKIRQVNISLVDKYREQAMNTFKIKKEEVDKYINVGVYVHFALLVIKSIELDIRIYEKEEHIDKAIEFLKIDIIYDLKFSSAIGYRGILSYYKQINLINKFGYEKITDYFFEAKKYLQQAMLNENKRNSQSFKYYNLWQQYFFLAESELKRIDSNKMLDEKIKVIEKERQQLFGLVTLLVSLITIVVAFVITLNHQDVVYLSSNESTISITTDKIFILFTLFSLVLLTYFLHYILANNNQKEKSKNENCFILDIKTILLITLGLFSIGLMIFLFGRYLL